MVPYDQSPTDPTDPTELTCSPSPLMSIATNHCSCFLALSFCCVKDMDRD